MKKTYIKKNMIKIGFLLIVCLFLFNSGCGLDVYTYIEGPDQRYNYPTEESSYENKYFHFATKEVKESDLGSSEYKGVSIYYRIYNCLSTMNSEVSTITNYIYSEDNKAKAVDRLLDTNELNQGYKPLLFRGNSDSILFNENETIKIKIRLSDYQYYESKGNDNDLLDYQAGIFFCKVNDDKDDDDKDNDDKVNDDNGNDYEYKGRPVRYSDDLTFNFGRYRIEDKSKIPQKDDLDVKFTDENQLDEDDIDKWYVAMFAVAVAMDESYTNNYSVPLYLGCIMIDQNEENN